MFANQSSRQPGRPTLAIVAASAFFAFAGGAFFGCKHFSKTNELLRQQGLEPIDWNLE